MATQTFAEKISSISFGKKYTAEELAELGTVKVIESGYAKIHYVITLGKKDYHFVKSVGKKFRLEYIGNSTYDPRMD